MLIDKKWKNLCRSAESGRGQFMFTSDYYSDNAGFRRKLSEQEITKPPN